MPCSVFREKEPFSTEQETVQMLCINQHFITLYVLVDSWQSMVPRCLDLPVARFPNYSFLCQ